MNSRLIISESDELVVLDVKGEKSRKIPLHLFVLLAMFFIISFKSQNAIFNVIFYSTTSLIFILFYTYGKWAHPLMRKVIVDKNKKNITFFITDGLKGKKELKIEYASLFLKLRTLNIDLGISVEALDIYKGYNLQKTIWRLESRWGKPEFEELIEILKKETGNENLDRTKRDK